MLLPSRCTTGGLCLILCLHLIPVLIMQPLVAASILNAQEAMLNHDEEDVLNDSIKLGVQTYTIPLKVKIIR